METYEVGEMMSQLRNHFKNKILKREFKSSLICEDFLLIIIDNEEFLFREGPVDMYQYRGLKLHILSSEEVYNILHSELKDLKNKKVA